MSTCLRNGVSYARHWYDDDAICTRCGHKSPWAIYMETEAFSLKPLTSVPIETEITQEMVERVMEDSNVIR
jgi:hypothetical protein